MHLWILAQRKHCKSLNNVDVKLPVYPAHTKQKRSSLQIRTESCCQRPWRSKGMYLLSKRSRKLYDIPIFAICLGHQLMALATGADTHKMKYGHRGGNHPVKDLKTKSYISSQNHGYVVDGRTLDPEYCRTSIC